jgi:hypothetical protein
MFGRSVERIADGSDHRPYLIQTRRRAEAEGRRADVDCVLLLAYAAACGDDPVRAAELIGACGGSVYRDTASYIHHAVIRDRVVRPRLAPAAFDAAVARGLDRPLAKILAEHGL